ncbi:MAG: DoxX family membrane protein [Chloroflexi bacterium]|nr:DoxX family membrane protein [Chloroflexota bacterium]
MANNSSERALLRDPGWVRALFSSTDLAWVWLIGRVYIGWLWIDAGWGKVQDDRWMAGGSALKGAWERMITVPADGRSAVAYDWYRQIIQLMYDQGWWTWFAKLVAVGEWMVGVALIVGAFTGITALIGLFMNWNFAMGGMGPGNNATMIVLAAGVFLAWKTAGWWGLDRWLLPALGTPWQVGKVFGGGITYRDGRPRMHRSEQWLRMFAGLAAALYALAGLSGAAQVIVLLLAGALVAVTGLGWLAVFRGFGERPPKAIQHR